MTGQNEPTERAVSERMVTHYVGDGCEPPHEDIPGEEADPPRCLWCGSPDPKLHPALQLFDGEVLPCSNPWHDSVPIGDTEPPHEPIPGEPEDIGHVYLSTACLHGRHEYCARDVGLTGTKTPQTCKWCPAQCVCPCHSDEVGGRSDG